jgi:hypothetical protein
VGNTPIIGAISTNSWRVSKFLQHLQTLYRTTILEFNRFLTDFGYELSNYKSEQLLPSSIIGSWWFFRARVDQLHMSNNASHIFFSVAILVSFSFFFTKMIVNFIQGVVYLTLFSFLFKGNIARRYNPVHRSGRSSVRILTTTFIVLFLFFTHFIMTYKNFCQFINLFIYFDSRTNRGSEDLCCQGLINYPNK